MLKNGLSMTSASIMEFGHVIDTRKNCSLSNHWPYVSKEVRIRKSLVKIDFQRQQVNDKQ